VNILQSLVQRSQATWIAAIWYLTRIFSLTESRQDATRKWIR
jgi:hypothetical protein